MGASVGGLVEVVHEMGGLAQVCIIWCLEIGVCCVEEAGVCVWCLCVELTLVPSSAI